MNWFSVVVTIFLAELGDKTQLATMMYASHMQPWQVFIAASIALVTSSALAVLAGQWLAGHISPVWLKGLAGTSFIVIGAFTLWEVWQELHGPGA